MTEQNLKQKLRISAPFLTDAQRGIVMDCFKESIIALRKRVLTEPEGYTKFIQGEQYVFQELLKEFENFKCPVCGSTTDTVRIEGRENFLWACNNPDCPSNAPTDSEKFKLYQDTMKKLQPSSSNDSTSKNRNTASANTDLK